MKQLAALLIFTLIPFSARPWGHVVGNGGDGYLMIDSGKVYLRDLVEAGLEEDTVIPTDVDPYLLKTVQFIPIPDPSESLRTKLARKLTEINKAHWGLGDYLLYTMKMYTWRFVSFPLEIIPTDGNIIAVPRSEFVQIANRMNTTIRIQKDLWSKMSEENQLALLLHEAVYSLILPESDDTGKSFQSSVKTREIVGLLFSRDFAVRGSAVIERTLRPVLDLPWTWNFPPRGETLQWRLFIMGKEKEESRRLLTINIAKQQKFSDLLLAANAICRKAYSFQQQMPQTEVYLLSHLERLSFVGKFIDYDSPFGEQYRVQITPYQGPPFDEKVVPSVSSVTQECEDQLRSELEKTAAEI